MKDHLTVDALLQGHLCLADGKVLKAVFDRQKVDASQIIDQLMSDVTKMISSMSSTGGPDGYDGSEVGDPTRMYTAELVLKLALYFHDNNVSFG